MSAFDDIERHAEERMRKVARALVRAFLAGEATVPELRSRGVRALGRKWPWLNRLAREVSMDFGEVLHAADHDELVGTILRFTPFRNAFESVERPPEVRGYFPFSHTMEKAPPALEALGIPALDTPGDVARWLELSAAELDWFADTAGWGSSSRAEALRHYRYRWLPKANGGLRLVEMPKSRLRAIQRRILREILDRVPAHDAAHGCIPRRSTLTNATAHAGRRIVIRLDLRDFFAGIPASRVHALFRTLGYPAPTARTLAGLTTACAPNAVVKSVPMDECAGVDTRRERRAWAKRFTGRHLPQGAPTSPALANLCAYRLDLRLSGAAHACASSYTRYVDDLHFSTDVDSQSRARRLTQMVYTIILEEGFTPNLRKTRIMARARAQRVTGLVVNEHPNLSRRHYDRLKAVLTNCVRRGPESQNRDGFPNWRAHLLGRVAYLQQVNLARGERLRRLYDAISWNES
jgi:hypothetical protein